MRPLVIVLDFFLLLALGACHSGPGPSSALELQPAVGAGLRFFAGPQDGVGAGAHFDMGQVAFRTGRAAEPAPAAVPATAGCPDRADTLRPDQALPEDASPDAQAAP